jgi:hypothetical protein
VCSGLRKECCDLTRRPLSGSLRAGGADVNSSSGPRDFGLVDGPWSPLPPRSACRGFANSASADPSNGNLTAHGGPIRDSPMARRRSASHPVAPAVSRSARAAACSRRAYPKAADSSVSAGRTLPQDLSSNPAAGRHSVSVKLDTSANRLVDNRQAMAEYKGAFQDTPSGAIPSVGRAGSRIDGVSFDNRHPGSRIPLGCQTPKPA